MRSVAAVSPAEIARSDRRNFVRKRILLTQDSRLWSICSGRANFVSGETRNDYPRILDLESSTFLPRERRKRAKLLSNEAYTLTRVGCQRGSDFEVYSFEQHPYS